MTSMFAGARTFNQPIGNWDGSSVTDMSFIFSSAMSFEQPLADWNVSRVTDMSNTFYSATSFSQSLVNWHVSSVRDVSFMFAYATSFNMSLADWNISNETDSRGIFAGADGVVEVQVQVQHDAIPKETGWTLRDSTGTLISCQSTGSFNTWYGTVAKTSSVALGTYTFEMMDAAGNGICCVFGLGSFSIVVNGESAVSNNGQFGNVVQETFEIRAPTPLSLYGL
jgi:surface protein